MFDEKTVRKMQEMAAPALQKRNDFVIRNGESAFQQSGALVAKLDAIINAEHNQIQEQIFIDLFLPFFASQFKKDVKLAIPVTIEHWIGATGDMIKPTDVIDVRGHVVKMADGTPLTIPAVYNRDSLRTMYANRDGNNAATGQILEEAKRYENMGETVVMGVMGKYLSDKARALRVSGQSLAVALHWNKIMAHYHLPPLYALEPTSPSDSASPSSTNASAAGGGDETYYELP